MIENFLRFNFFFLLKTHSNITWTYKLVRKKEPKEGGKII
jgi:hypothetical protein